MTVRKTFCLAIKCNFVENYCFFKADPKEYFIRLVDYRLQQINYIPHSTIFLNVEKKL